MPAPSMGVPEELHERLRAAVASLTGQGLDVHVRDHATTGGLVPASAADRVQDLHTSFRSGDAVLPPWGGELAIELLDGIDWAALADAQTWFVGWSDISTLLLPLTTITGLATMHGANLMDEPWDLPKECHRWTDVASMAAGSSFQQRSAPRRRSRPWAAWSEEPLDRDRAYETLTRWRAIDGRSDLSISGRLIGGCLETVSLLAGTPYGDVPRFALEHAPEGTLVYLEAAGSDAIGVMRMLRSLRLAGWFDAAKGILIGRTNSPDTPDLSQEDAVRRALGDIDVPVVLDFDTGHQPPQMPLVNGALADVTLVDGQGSITQHLTA